MAGSSANASVYVDFYGRDMSASRVAKKVNTQLGIMNGKYKGLALRLIGYNLALNAVMGAQQKLMQFIGDSITKFREFELRLAEISTILTEDKDQIERFKVGIERLAIAYGQATSDISKGLYDIMSAAFSSREAMNLLNTAIKASIAGLSDVRTSVGIFTAVLNSYGMTAEQATHISDVLFQSVVRGKFQFKDLEQALGYVVPIAAQAGLQFDELTAALSTATRHGLHLDMTARGLALAIQGIVNPSEKALKAAKKYGVEMSGLSLRVLGLKGWFDQVGKASDKFGKGIIGELIPNMRSVRVAMVLAGEEGVKGFAEDLLYLESVTGRTDVALQEIMKTQEFMAKRLAQKKEQIQRDIGEPWSEAVLDIQDYILTVARAIQLAMPANTPESSFAPKESQLSLWDRYKKKREEAGESEKNALIENYALLNDYSKALIYMQSLQAASETSTILYDAMATGASKKVLEDLNDELERHNLIMEITQDSYNRITGDIQNVQMELARLETLLDELVVSKRELSEKLFDPVQYGAYNKTIKGTLYLEEKRLIANKNLADGQHDVDRAMIDSSHVWVTNNQAVKDAVAALREHKNAVKVDRIETEIMSAAMRKLQIQMLELQLIGMTRRRGMSRSEEKMMKKLQIEQAKLRLENMKSQDAQTENMIVNHNKAQAIIDEFLGNLSEESYQLGYMYNQQKADLDDVIEYEKGQYKTRTEEIKKTYLDISTESQLLYDKLMKLAENPDFKTAWEEQFDISIEPIIASALARIKSALAAGGGGSVSVDNVDSGSIGSPYDSYDSLSARQLHNFQEFSRGTEYVHKTMPVMIHRGEQIIPAGGNASGGDTFNVNISVSATVSQDYDVEQLAAKLGESMQTQLMNKKGRSKFRMV